MRDSSGHLRLSYGLLILALISVLGCATPPTTLKSDQLPPFPMYEVRPVEIPCNIGETNRGARRCYIKLVDDEQALILYTKQVCYVLTGNREYCRMDPAE